MLLGFEAHLIASRLQSLESESRHLRFHDAVGSDDACACHAIAAMLSVSLPDLAVKVEDYIADLRRLRVRVRGDERTEIDMKIQHVIRTPHAIREIIRTGRKQSHASEGAFIFKDFAEYVGLIDLYSAVLPSLAHLPRAGSVVTTDDILQMFPRSSEEFRARIVTSIRRGTFAAYVSVQGIAHWWFITSECVRGKRHCTCCQ